MVFSDLFTGGLKCSNIRRIKNLLFYKDGRFFSTLFRQHHHFLNSTIH